MKAAWSMLVVLAVAMFLIVAANAQDKDKEVTLKGTITCAKCDLKVPGQTSCATVISVKEGDKDVVYYFDKETHKKNHATICKEPMKGEVKGTVAEAEGKKTIKVSEVKFGKS